MLLISTLKLFEDDTTVSTFHYPLSKIHAFLKQSSAERSLSKTIIKVEYTINIAIKIALREDI